MFEFNPNDRFTWCDAPSWWNPTGERIANIDEKTVMLDYSGIRIPFSNLILVICNI